jgi:hypothetical protein
VTDIDQAYRERNQLVTLLANMALAKGWKAGRRFDRSQEVGWENVVVIDLPTGQVSWHIGVHDGPVCQFETLPTYDGEWDGHTTDEKWERVRAYRTKLADAPKGDYRTGLVHKGYHAEVVERLEAQRDEARAEVGRVQLQLEGALDRSREGAWMARALDAERELATARAEVERLRAALAAAPERPVTWESEPGDKFVKGYRADSLQIIITRLVSGRCEWNAWLDWEDDGEAATVEEAQAAAIKAVKEAW